MIKSVRIVISDLSGEPPGTHDGSLDPPVAAFDDNAGSEAIVFATFSWFSEIIRSIGSLCWNDLILIGPEAGRWVGWALAARSIPAIDSRRSIPEQFFSRFILRFEMVYRGSDDLDLRSEFFCVRWIFRLILCLISCVSWILDNDASGWILFFP